MQEEQVRAAADAFIRRMSLEHGVELTYDRTSVEWVEGYIERLRPRTDLPALHHLMASVAALLGECLLRLRPGRWLEFGGEWVVHFEDGSTAFPLQQVSEQFAGSEGASMLAYYDGVAAVFAAGEDASSGETGRGPVGRQGSRS